MTDTANRKPAGTAGGNGIIRGKEGRAYLPSLGLKPLKRAPEGSTGGCVEAHLRLMCLREARHRAEWLRERLNSMERQFLPAQHSDAGRVDHSREGSVTESLAVLRLELEEKLAAAETEHARAYADCCRLIGGVRSVPAREALTLVYLEGLNAQDAADRMEISLSGLNSFKRDGLKEIQRTLE